MKFEGKLMELEIMLWNKTQKDESNMFAFIWESWLQISRPEFMSRNNHRIQESGKEPARPT